MYAIKFTALVCHFAIVPTLLLEAKCFGATIKAPRLRSGSTRIDLRSERCKTQAMHHCLYDESFHCILLNQIQHEHKTNAPSYPEIGQ
jgi:hypothetical protein